MITDFTFLLLRASFRVSIRGIDSVTETVQNKKIETFKSMEGAIFGVEIATYSLSVSGNNFVCKADFVSSAQARLSPNGGVCANRELRKEQFCLLLRQPTKIKFAKIGGICE